jgi:hypothetical protein
MNVFCWIPIRIHDAAPMATPDPEHRLIERLNDLRGAFFGIDQSSRSEPGLE